MLYIYFHTLTTFCDSSGSRMAFGGFEGALVGGNCIVCVDFDGCVGCGGWLCRLWRVCSLWML